MRRWRQTLLVTVTLAASVEAQAAGWSDLGNLLSQACSFSGVGGIPLDIGSSTEWACQLKGMYVFINNNIVNGDWVGFAKDVAGKYISDFLNKVAENLGVGALNQYTTDLNDALRTTYKEFRKYLLGQVSTLMKSTPNPNAAFRVETAGGMAARAIKLNPNLTIQEQTAKLDDTLEKMKGLNTTFKINKDQQQANEAIEANTAPAMATATSVLGTPTQEGKATKFENDAAAAVSAREVSEVMVRVGAEQLRMNAVNSVALLNQLSHLTQQIVMTNANLSMQRDQMQKEMASKMDQLNASLEAEAQENLTTAIETSKGIYGTYANASNAFQGSAVDFSEVAP